MVPTRLARASGRPTGRASKDDEIRALLEREKELENSLRDEHQDLASEIRQTNDDLELIRSSLKAAEVIEDACGAAEDSVRSLQTHLHDALDLHQNVPPPAQKMLSTKRLDAACVAGSGIIDQFSSSLEDPISAAKSHLILLRDKVVVQKDRIKRKEQALKAAQKKLFEVQVNISHIRMRLPPLDRFPDAILRHIFQYAVNGERGYLRRAFPGLLLSLSTKSSLPYTSFAVAATCEQWRRIALTTPQLWSYLRVPTVERLGATRKEILVGKIHFEQSLALCGDSQLELTIFPTAREDTTEAFLRSIPVTSTVLRVNLIHMKTLPGYLPPTKHLCLGGHPFPFQGSVNLPQATLNALIPTTPISPSHVAETEQMTCIGEVAPQFEGPAPKLRYLTFDLLDPRRLPALVSILQQLPVLSSLFMSCGLEYPSATPGAFPFVHARLTTITVNIGYFRVLCDAFLQGLSLPALRHLVLLDLNQVFSGSSEESAVTTNLARVTHFELRDMSAAYKMPHLTKFYNILTAMQSLTLCRRAANFGLEALGNSSISGLREIVMMSSEVDGTAARGYVDRIRRRVKGGTQPLRVRFIKCPNVSPETRARLAS
jgi:F-box-like